MRGLLPGCFAARRIGNRWEVLTLDESPFAPAVRVAAVIPERQRASVAPLHHRALDATRTRRVETQSVAVVTGHYTR